MKLVTFLAEFINIITIIVFLTALFCKFENPKRKAIFGYVVVASIIAYLIFMGLYLISTLVLVHDLRVLWMLLFMVSPFVIGVLVRYETLRLFTMLQILSFAGSLWFICYL